MKTILTFIALSLCGAPLHAQEARKDIRQGNKLLNKGKVQEAEVSYRKALERDPNTVIGTFNLGNSLYRQNKYEEAGKGYIKAAEGLKAGSERSGAYHNLGNSLVQQKKLEEGINAYKQALRENPSDVETKYNLAYAQRLLKKKKDEDKKNQDKQNQEQKNKEPNKPQQEQKNKEQGNKNPAQDKKKPGTQNKEQGTKDQEQNKQGGKDGQQPTPPPSAPKNGSIAPEDAQRLLEALQNDEKGIQEKVQRNKNSNTRQVEKNW